MDEPIAPAPTMGREQILAYLNELVEATDSSTGQQVIILVGGAVLAEADLREATRDVDSIVPLSATTRDAAAVIAARHGLPARWLNDNATGFRPATLREADCEVLLERPGLKILSAPLRQVFLMKLFASRSRDVRDMQRIWPLLNWTPAEAVEQFREAYPHEPEDEHLLGFVTGIQAGSDAEQRRRQAPARRNQGPRGPEL